MFGQIDLSSQNPEWVEIKDVGVVLTGSTPKTGVDKYWDGNNLWITPAELTSDRKYYDDTQRKITDLGVQSCSLDQIEPGTVLLTSRAPIGKVGIATTKMYCNQGFKNIKCGPRINSEYLYTLIFYNTEYLNSLGRGATFKEISRKIVESIRIPVPPIELQNQFADFVRQVDKSKLIFQQMVSRFDELVKSRFIEMFGSVQSNVYKWEIKTIDELSQVPLSYGSQASAIDYDGHIRYVRITDISDGGTLNDDVKSPSIVDKKYFLDEGDILFARSGATAGKTYIYHEKDGQCIYAGYLIRMKPDSSIIDPDFMYHFTSTADYISFVEESRRGAAQPNINAKQYGSVEVIVPPLDLQKKFVSFVRQVDKSKSNLLCYVNTLLNNGD